MEQQGHQWAELSYSQTFENKSSLPPKLPPLFVAGADVFVLTDGTDALLSQPPKSSSAVTC